MQWTAWAGLSPQMFGLAFLGAFILGVSKAGVKGIAVLIVTLMALAFGSKPSTGLLMPLLLVGDVFAIAYYHQHAQWSYLKRFLPWMMTGVLIGVWVGDQVDEATFQQLMGYIGDRGDAHLVGAKKRSENSESLGICRVNRAYGGHYHHDRQFSWSLLQCVFFSDALTQAGLYRHGSLAVLFYQCL